jgi:hypothetical protein
MTTQATNTNDPGWNSLFNQDPQSGSTQGPTPTGLGSTTGSAERRDAGYPENEKVVLEERAFPKEVEPGVKDWMTKLEAGEDISLPQAVTDDQGQVLADNAAPQQVVVTLPMSEEQIEKALKQKIVESVRWLGEWMRRVVRIVGGTFNYKTKQS